MYNLHLSLIEDEQTPKDSSDDTQPSAGAAPASPAKSSTSSPSSSIQRFNPYATNKDKSFSLNSEHLGMPPLSSEAAKKIIKLMEEWKDHRKLIPAIVHRLYFNALLQQKKYDIVFILATKLAYSIRQYEFSKILYEIMEEVTLPRFTK